MGNIFSELKRRNVIRVGLAYVVTAWLLLQVTDVVLNNIEAPEWVFQAIMLVLAIGFPIALLFAWAYEMTPEGLKKEKDVDRSQSITPVTGRKLDFIIIGMLVLALGYFLWERQSYVTPSAELTSATAGSTLKRSIAVLPFINMSSDQDQEWFADGLTEEILNALARMPDLLVAARTSSFGFKGSTLPIQKIADTLGVAHVLEGSVRRGADRLRVTAQLIRANDGFHLWSETYDRSSDDVIAIQEDVAIAIANALETAMDPEALEQMVSAGTSSVPAYEAYLEALAYQARSIQSGDEQFTLNQRTALERAQKLDPEFAAVHFEMASFWQGQMSVTSFGSELTSDTAEERKEKYKAAVAKAIQFEKDPDRRTKYRADEAFVELRYLETLRLMADYLADRPNDREAVALQMSALINLGRWKEAQVSAQHLADISGSESQEMQNAIVNLVFSGDTSGAADVSRRALQLHPDNALIAYQAHRAFLWDGAIDEARIILPTVIGSQIPAINKNLATLRQACADGNTARALKIHEDFALQFQAGESILWISHHMLGQREQASALLRPYDEANQMYALSSYLVYSYFDPTPHPRLMEILNSQGIDRPPPIDIPFRCDLSPETI
jgi:TolB-like protein/Flp pilus assembly protein TadD